MTRLKIYNANSIRTEFTLELPFNLEDLQEVINVIKILKPGHNTICEIIQSDVWSLRIITNAIDFNSDLEVYDGIEENLIEGD